MSTFIADKNKPKAGHDSDTPPNLLNFMLTSWKPAHKKMPAPVRHTQNHRRRRLALSKLFPGEVLLIPTGHLKVRANDQFYRFRPGTDFYYLTGSMEPDCVLIMTPKSSGDGHAEMLFVEPNPGKTDATFFTDRVKGELWEGARHGVPESQALYGIKDCRSLTELPAVVTELMGTFSGRLRILPGLSERLEQWSHQNQASQLQRNKELANTLSEMRLIKDAEEIKEISAAIKATKLGFEDVIRRLKSAKIERELEGVFFTRARVEGNDVGYASIVASGAHACTLHWNKNDGRIKKGDLLLLDAGIEGNTLYTADVTRTLPISGKFTKEQRQVYELVLAAQAAAFKQVKPGNDFMAPNRAAMQILAHGLEALGILPMSAEEALREENQFYKRYSLHNVSHMLGLDVHDCAQARAETYKYGKLQAGMVLTIEPGLYFQVDDLTVPAKYRGIGVRIEDDVVVTDKGYRNLSAVFPSKVEDVERWIKSLWSRPK